jgi:hypothetical protein
MNGTREGVGGFVIEILRRIAGPSFSTAESVFISAACIAAGVGFAVYSEFADWGWSAIQQVAAGFLVFDLVGGAIAYNAVPSKLDRFDRSSFMDYLPHQLLHIHPIVAAFFYTQWLPWVFAGFLVAFVLFVAFFEPKPVLRGAALKAITALMLAVALALIAASLVVESGRGLYGGAVYLSLILGSIAVFVSPVRAQAMVAASIVILMCLLNGTVITPPSGFSWLVPVFFVKLVLGYMARTRLAEPVPAPA